MHQQLQEEDHDFDFKDVDYLILSKLDFQSHQIGDFFYLWSML